MNASTRDLDAELMLILLQQDVLRAKIARAQWELQTIETLKQPA